MKKGIALLLISSLLLTGCWDRRELNELSITMGIGIDKSDKGYLVSTQVVVPLEVSIKTGKGSSPVTLFQAEGETLFEAIKKLAKIVPREIYPGHLRILVISEEVAEEGIGDILDFFSRNWEVRSDYFVVVAKDMKAEEILNVATAIEIVPANNMYDKLNVANENWSSTRGMTVDHLIRDIASEGKEAVVTGIEIYGEDPKMGSSKTNVESIIPAARIRLTDLGVFKEDKLVGWLTEKESIGYNKITNQVKSSVTNICTEKDGEIAIELIRANAEIKAKVKNGEPEVEVVIETEGNIAEVDCQIDLTKAEAISKLEKIYAKNVKEIMEKSIEAVQEDYGSDIFGFGEAIHRADPNAWKKLKKDWEQKFTELQVKVKVDAKISQVGTITNPLQINEED